MLSASLATPTFLINSRNRTTGDINNFQYTIPLAKNNDFNAVALVSATISKSFYTITAFGGQNVFVLYENSIGRFITIPEGYYDYKSFIVVLKGLLNTGGLGWVYDMTYTTYPRTNKFVWTVTGNGGLQPQFSFSNDRMHEIMGFVKDSNNPFVGDTLTSTEQFNMQHTRYVTVKSNICSNLGSTSDDFTVLATISTQNTPDGNNIVYQMTDLMEGQRLLSNNQSNSFSFSIYDDHDRLLQLNNVNWKCKILCYKFNDYYQRAITSTEPQRR